MNPPFSIVPDSCPKPFSRGISVPGGHIRGQVCCQRNCVGSPSHRSETENRGLVLGGRNDKLVVEKTLFHQTFNYQVMTDNI